jgi:hypothetical protein
LKLTKEQIQKIILEEAKKEIIQGEEEAESNISSAEGEFTDPMSADGKKVGKEVLFDAIQNNVTQVAWLLENDEEVSQDIVVLLHGALKRAMELNGMKHDHISYLSEGGCVDFEPSPRSGKKVGIKVVSKGLTEVLKKIPDKGRATKTRYFKEALYLAQRVESDFKRRNRRKKYFKLHGPEVVDSSLMQNMNPDDHNKVVMVQFVVEDTSEKVTTMDFEKKQKPKGRKIPKIDLGDLNDIINSDDFE